MIPTGAVACRSSEILNEPWPLAKLVLTPLSLDLPHRELVTTEVLDLPAQGAGKPRLLGLRALPDLDYTNNTFTLQHRRNWCQLQSPGIHLFGHSFLSVPPTAGLVADCGHPKRPTTGVVGYFESFGGMIPSRRSFASSRLLISFTRATNFAGSCSIAACLHSSS